MALLTMMQRNIKLLVSASPSDVTGAGMLAPKGAQITVLCHCLLSSADSAPSYPTYQSNHYRNKERCLKNSCIATGVPAMCLCDVDLKLNVSIISPQNDNFLWRSCTAEHLFSTFNWVTTSNRATQLTGWLNSLSILSFEKELTQTQNYHEMKF